MPKIQLTKAGDTCTFNVKKCEVVEGQHGEQVKFTAQNDDVLYIGRAPADRELLHAGFGEGEGDTAAVFYGDVDGQTLTFSRIPAKKAGQSPYWEITRVLIDDEPRPSLAKAARAAAEAIRKERNIPRDDDEVPPPDDNDTPDWAGRMGDLPNDPAKPTGQKAPAFEVAAARFDTAYRHAWSVAVDTQGEFGTPDSIENAAVTLFIAYNQARII